MCIGRYLLGLAALLAVQAGCKSDPPATSAPIAEKLAQEVPPPAAPPTRADPDNAWTVWSKIPKESADEVQAFLSAAMMLGTKDQFKDLENREALLALKELGDSQSQALKWLGEGTAHAACVFPIASETSALTLTLFKLAELQLGRSTLAALEGRISDALEGIEKNLAFGHRLASCPGSILSLSVALASLQQTLSAASLYARLKMLTPAQETQLEAMMRGLVLDSKILVDSLRVESSLVAHSLRYGPLATLQGRAEYLHQSSALLKVVPGAVAALHSATLLSGNGAEAEEALETASQELRAGLDAITDPDEKQIAALAAVLGQHPDLLDVDKTNALIEDSLSEISNALSTGGRSWPQVMEARSIVIMQELSEELGPGIEILLQPKNAKSTSAATLQRFLKVPNPMGRMSFAQQLALSSRVVSRLQSELDAVEAKRVVLHTGLVVCGYLRAGGAVPADLPALVATRVLAALPQDPYARGPLRYDQAALRIWSIGLDGENQAGDGLEKRSLSFSCSE